MPDNIYDKTVEVKMPLWMFRHIEATYKTISNYDSFYRDSNMVTEIRTKCQDVLVKHDDRLEGLE